MSRLWNFVRTHGRRFGKEVAKHAPDVFTPEVRESIRRKMLDGTPAPGKDSIDWDKLHPAPPVPDFTKADPFNSDVYESPPIPDFSIAFLPREDTAPPPARESVDMSNRYYFGGSLSGT